MQTRLQKKRRGTSFPPGKILIPPERKEIRRKRDGRAEIKEALTSQVQEEAENPS